MIEGRTRGDISRAKQMLRERAADGARTARTHRSRDRAVSGNADCRRRVGDPTFRHLGGRIDARGIRRVRAARDANGVRFARRRGSAENSIRQGFGAFAGKLGAVRRGRNQRGLAYGFGGSARDIRPVAGRSVALQGNVDPNILLGAEAGRARSRASRGGKNRRPRPHSESGPRNPAHDSRCKRQSLRRKRDKRRACRTRRE